MKPIDFLNDLAQKLHSQDNAYTSLPVYCIQEKMLICGIDEDYGGNVGWFSEEARFPEDESSRKHRALERYYDRYSKEPDGWTRCGYVFRWKYTGISFFTKEAADKYVKERAYNHTYGVRVYVDSLYRNPEMREIRRLLAGPIPNCITILKEVTDELRQLHAHHYGKCEGGCPAETYIKNAELALESLTTGQEPMK